MTPRGAALALALALLPVAPPASSDPRPERTDARAATEPRSPLLAYAASLDARFLPDLESHLARLRAVTRRLERASIPASDCHLALGARRYAELLAELGRAHAALGETEPAIASFRRALECAPRDPEHHAELGDELLDAGRLAEAAEASARGLAISTTSYGLNSLQLRLDFLAERWADVVSRAEYLLATSGDDEMIFYWNFFRRAAERRLGREPTVVAEERIPERWPGALWRHLSGEIDEQALVAAMRDEADGELRRREMACEALYYTALERLDQGWRDAARERLAAAVNLKVIYFLEHALARAELAKLRERVDPHSLRPRARAPRTCSS